MVCRNGTSHLAEIVVLPVLTLMLAISVTVFIYIYRKKIPYIRGKCNAECIWNWLQPSFLKHTTHVTL